MTNIKILKFGAIYSVVRLERPTMEYSSSRRIIPLVPVFILEKHNQTYNITDALSIWTDYASSSIKTASRSIRTSPFLVWKPKELHGWKSTIMKERRAVWH